jgi:beta-alanine degradation protein BauB
MNETPPGATGSAIGTKLIDNDRVSVWEWRFPNTEDNTGWHRHEHDYVVVPMMDGIVRVRTIDGETSATMSKGAPYFRTKGIEHDVINANPGEYVFIEIELKP